VYCKKKLLNFKINENKKLNITVILLLMIPIANAQNEESFDSKSVGLAYVRKSTVGDAWKVENGTLHFDPKQKKTIKGEI
jgi:hypothetical protein